MLGLPAYLALYPALGFALARLLWTKDASRIVALAIALTMSEWLRGHLLTGFPWNAYGYALSEPLALAQIASVIGLWGMTFLAVAIFASPAVLIEGKSRRRPWLPAAAAIALLLALGIFGAVRLSLQPTKMVSHGRGDRVILLAVFRRRIEFVAAGNDARGAIVVAKIRQRPDRIHRDRDVRPRQRDQLRVLVNRLRFLAGTEHQRAERRQETFLIQHALDDRQHVLMVNPSFSRSLPS